MIAMRVLLMTVVAMSALVFLPPDGTPAECGGLHRLKILDLDMVPDPARHGQPIQRWVVKLKADGNGECATRIQVRDRNQLAGSAIRWTLRPGENEISIPANPHYKMQDQDHCFTVVADIQNNPTDIDGSRPFCAKASWTLKGDGASQRGRDASSRSPSTERSSGTFKGDYEGRAVSR
jgi:hypothetical protein